MSAYKFRVLLDSSKDEEIFRDIVISKNDSFERFYRTILKSFDFSNEEMASFYMSNDDWDKGHEITLMDMSFGDEDNDAAIMSSARLKDEVLVAGQKIILVHDFLKMWIFLIELQQEIEEVVDSPYVALSIGISPDENSKRDDIVMETDFIEDEEDDYFDGFESLDDEDFSDGFESYDEFNY
jgi:hypothetical protein